VAQSGAEVLVAADSGCLMNIGGALARAGRSTRCLPLAQFIAERTQSGRAAGTQGGGHAA
jgi:L-lactate dehydrogenase complex protein LldE